MELTHKERVTLQNLDPKCEDCDYYREYNGRLDKTLHDWAVIGNIYENCESLL